MILLNGLEDGCRKVLTKWRRDSTDAFDHLIKQRELVEMHAELSSQAKLHNQLITDTKKKWPFAKSYSSEANPIETLDVDRVIKQEPEGMSDAPGYDVHTAWARLRLRQAEECQKFIVAHTQAALQFAEHDAKHPQLYSSCEDAVNSWLTNRTPQLTESDKKFTLEQACKYARMILRVDENKLLSKAQVVKDEKKKANEALNEADTKWEGLDSLAIMGEAFCQLDELQKAGKRQASHVKRDSALGVLLSKCPSAASTFNLQPANAKAERTGPKNKSKPKAKAKSRASDRGRSGSRASSRASSRGSRTSGKSHRSTKSGSASRRSNTPHPRNRSKPSRSSSRSKGRGKGKDSRKGGRGGGRGGQHQSR